MRVLHVIDGLGTGGAERSLAELLPLFTAAGVENVVCCQHRRPRGVEEAVIASGVPVRFLPDGHPMAKLRALRHVLRELRPDIVHTTLFSSTLLGRIATLGSGVPVLTSVVNTSYGTVRLRDPNLTSVKLRTVHLADALTARRSAHFHAITEAVKNEAVVTLRVPPERITVVPRGRDEVRLGRRQPERAARARAALGIGDAPLVLAAGRQEYQKGHRFLLEATSLIHGHLPEAVVAIAGRDGAASGTLHAAHRRMHSDPRVRFLGHRTDLPELLAACDVFVFPSLFEGLGGTLLEAMALEAPVVASDIPAVREVLDDGRAGVLVPPADAASLGKAICGLLDDRDRRKALAAVGRRRFEAEFRIDAVADQMLALYRHVSGR